MKTQILRHLTYTLDEMECFLHEGRVSQALYSAWLYVWQWSTFRHAGAAGCRQDAFWNTHGKDAFYAKMNKCRQAFGFAPYPVL